jgi:hypothetical protein
MSDEERIRKQMFNRGLITIVLIVVAFILGIVSM